MRIWKLRTASLAWLTESLTPNAMGCYRWREWRWMGIPISLCLALWVQQVPPFDPETRHRNPIGVMEFCVTMSKQNRSFQLDPPNHHVLTCLFPLCTDLFQPQQWRSWLLDNNNYWATATIIAVHHVSSSESWLPRQVTHYVLAEVIQLEGCAELCINPNNDGMWVDTSIFHK